MEVLQARFVSRGVLPENAVGLTARLRDSASANGSMSEETARDLYKFAKEIYTHAQLAIGKAAFE